MEGSVIRIVVADDHPLFRGALRQALASLLPGAQVIEANGLDELTATLGREGDVDLVLLDLTMPGVQGFSGLIYLRAQHPDVPVVIVSANEDPVVIRRAIEFGASGFIPKSLEQRPHRRGDPGGARRRHLDAARHRAQRLRGQGDGRDRCGGSRP